MTFWYSLNNSFLVENNHTNILNGENLSPPSGTLILCDDNMTHLPLNV